MPIIFHFSHPNKNQEDQKEAEKLEPIVGHVSMVTDMVSVHHPPYSFFILEKTNRINK